MGNELYKHAIVSKINGINADIECPNCGTFWTEICKEDSFVCPNFECRTFLKIPNKTFLRILKRRETMTFEEEFLKHMKNELIKFISAGSWINVPYDKKITIDPSLIKKCYDQIDMTEVLRICKEKLEQHVADKIFNAMATEVATDVKQILSNGELREDCRSFLRTKIREVEKALS